MDIKQRLISFSVLIGLVVALVIISGCGGNSTSTAPTATPVVVATATQTIESPTPQPTATSVPQATAAPTNTPRPNSIEVSSEEQIAQGKLLFDKTAGGVGCALCHGLDALGIPEQGAPANIGASWETIEQSLFDRPQMSFISLTRDEIKAVAAYLQWLEQQQ